MKIFSQLISLVFFSLSVAQAAELSFSPETPTVEVGDEIILSVSGFKANNVDIKWTAGKGKISQGMGTEVTYSAPFQAGFDVVTAFDNEGNIGTVNIEVIPCENLEDRQCKTPPVGNRAAIIIAGSDKNTSLWQSVESISNRIYQVFRERGLGESEIYYLSPQAWADYNNDGFDDKVTYSPIPERNLIADDVQEAFEWAKGIGQLSQPLYVFFTGHGDVEKLLLSKDSAISAEKFKTFVDDYQNSTGNQVIITIDASHSGSFLNQLAAPNRAIISSTQSDEKAYFLEKQGFSYFLADNLQRGMDFLEAFNDAISEIDKIFKQNPQFNDNNDGQWLRQIHVNGPFTTADITLSVKSSTESSHLSVGQSISLKAQTNTVSDDIESVWAVIRPPKMDFILDSYGTPIIAFPHLNLFPTEEENVWQTTWSDVVYNGDYEINFYAQDKQGNIGSSEKFIIITVEGGVEPPEQAKVQITLDKIEYSAGETIKVELTEDLGWGYDLFAAVVLPDGNFIAFENTNKFRRLNEAKAWYGQRTQNTPVTLVDFTLPENLAVGEYCVYGILSPKQENVFETLAQDLWVMDRQCFLIRN